MAADSRIPTSFALAPVPFADTWTLERELGVHHLVAQTLARRGLRDVEQARRFLAADESHSPRAFRGIARAAELIGEHVRRGSVITVHGDYDTDGVCATAILVAALRSLGADVDWYLPDRIADGYGLGLETVARLASRGTALLVTVDCAITAVEAVAAARAAGMDVVVTDHHSPREDGLTPVAPIVHPALCGYPCADLCATAVAAKLAQVLRFDAGLGADERPEELELVAMATIADVVPLRGENRRLVRAGLRALAGTARPGLRALMSVAGVSPLNVDEQAVAFRLAPRLNAAGRLRRPDSALELLMTDDESRAGELAGELNQLNAERRHVEQRIAFEAEAQVRETGPAAAYVLAGAGWHPGVIGIVAARIAERMHRPAVLVALPAVDGELAVGSGRSIAAFDLLAGLDAASARLVTHGGHRAAAGLAIRAEDVDRFRVEFVAHAERVLQAADLVSLERVDAVADSGDVELAVVEQLAALAPFGAANPSVSLLFAAASLSDAVGFGEADAHVRFAVSSGGARARAVAFGRGARLPVSDGEPADCAFTLERNEWNGAVEPRLVLRAAAPSEPPPFTVVGEHGDFLERALGEFERGSEAPTATTESALRTVRDRRGRGIAATIVELVAGGEPVLVVCAATAERSRHLEGRLGGFELCSYGVLERDPQLVGAYTHVVLLDPPASETQRTLACSGTAAQFTHLAWGAAELKFALHILERECELRDALAVCYRQLRDSGGVSGERLEALLRGEEAAARPPELAGRLLAVLSELDLVAVDRSVPAAHVTERRKATLETSATYRSYQQRLQDGLRYLEPNKAQAAWSR